MIEIYGTLGPACADEDILADMIREGMTGIRLNLSHTTLAESGDMLKKLRMAEEAEQLLFNMGFSQLRVRLHEGNVARIELMPEEFLRFMEKDVRLLVHEKFKNIGFDYAALDIIGYRTGSLNEAFNDGRKK